MKTQLSTTDIQADHQHWLREIERWENYVAVWEEQEKRLTEEYTRMQHAVDQHGRHIRQHARDIAELKATIAECERKMMGGHDDVTDSLTEQHGKGTARHDDQRTVHEKLKQEHHTLMAAMAVFQQKPFRDE